MFKILRVEVQGPYILVAMRGTCLRANFGNKLLLGSQWMRMRKTQKLQSHFKEFRSLAWEAANERACELGWVRSCGELH